MASKNLFVNVFRQFSSSSVLRSSSPGSRGAAALIVGAGDSTGSAIAKAFAGEGYTICAARRNGDKLAPLIQEITSKGGQAHPFGVDCRKEDLVVKMVEDIETKIGPIEVAVFNVGANVQFKVTDTTARVYYKVWEMACFAGFLVGKEVAIRMMKRGQGTIIFTGATASIRGGAGFCAFSGAKHGLRSLAQSMSRELGPQGIHVAHVLIDGPIDTPFIHEVLPGASELAKVQGLLEPDHIAQNYIHLHKQPKTAWTFELDLRPYIEKW